MHCKSGRFGASVVQHPASSPPPTPADEASMALTLDFFSPSYDQRGVFLLAGTVEGNIFVIDARPSSSFKIFGYTGMPYSHLFV